MMAVSTASHPTTNASIDTNPGRSPGPASRPCAKNAATATTTAPTHTPVIVCRSMPTAPLAARAEPAALRVEQDYVEAPRVAVVCEPAVSGRLAAGARADAAWRPRADAGLARPGRVG